MDYSLLVDLERCVGCHACEIACIQEHGLKPGARRIHVTQLGPRQVGGRLRMEFIPFAADACTLCVHRVNRGLEPACVTDCPTEAMRLCTEAEALGQLGSGRRWHVCKTLRVDEGEKSG